MIIRCLWNGNKLIPPDYWRVNVLHSHFCFLLSPDDLANERLTPGVSLSEKKEMKKLQRNHKLNLIDLGESKDEDAHRILDRIAGQKSF